jgi:hypothetical protein
MQEGHYPELAVFSGMIPFEPNGAGTMENPYLITNANELGSVWYRPLAHYRLDASIDLESIHWSCAVVPWFDGHFDGNGFLVYSLRISGSSHLGLFGTLGPNASVIHVGLENVDVNGLSSYVGGLVGENDRGHITSCYSTGSITGGDEVGGLVGFNFYGRIASSYSTVTINGEKGVGGLLGRNYFAYITSSFSVGKVSGEEYVGGLVGQNYSYSSITSSYSSGVVDGDEHVGGFVGNNAGSITSSYSTGIVSGDYKVGGLAGSNYNLINSSYNMSTVIGVYMVGGLVGDNSGNITSSYNNGFVSGDYKVGGLAGANSGSITSSFWDNEISGLTTSDGGTGLSTAQMQDPNNYLNAGWDFVVETDNGTEDIWFMPENSYPLLWWQ